MSIISPVLNDNNSVGYSIGFQFKLRQVFKDGRKADVMLITTKKENLFYGLFDVEDTDFEIFVDNKSCQRNIGFDIEIYPNSGLNIFYIKKGQSDTLKALEMEGPHLHFVSQSTEEGRILVGTNARRNKASYKEASINCSRIEFLCEVEKSLAKPKGKAKVIDIKIVIERLNIKKTLNLSVQENWTVEMIKEWIEDKEGYTPMNQFITFNGSRRLEDRTTLKEVGVINGSVLDIIIMFRGAQGGNHPRTEVGEPGVVCFGKETDQHFGTYHKFRASEEFILKPFIIELRMKSKYSLSKTNN